MTNFGKKLREFRQRCDDNKSPHGRLTQEKFAELVGTEMGISYTGAAVSDWEREKSKIHADDRRVLIALIKVLHEKGGLKTVEQANQLLESGNYRDLDNSEVGQIFEEAPDELSIKQPIPKQKNSKSFFSNLFTSFLSISEEEFQELLARTEEGPSPAWPRIIVAVFRRFSDRFSVSNVLTFISWIWVWLLAWVLIAPSLRWPFSSRDEAWLAIVIYAGGAIVLPAFIGAQTNTKNNEFWQKQKVRELSLRLYTHQGASIGFHVGYFFIFIVGLFRYNLGFTSILWLELVVTSIPVILGYASARLIPYNLLLAYEQLNLRDGRIFFVFFLFSPVWGYFLLQSYDILLTRSLGIVTVLIAVTILVAMMALRYRQSGTTVIPVTWWMLLFGSFVLCPLLVLFTR